MKWVLLVAAVVLPLSTVCEANPIVYDNGSPNLTTGNYFGSGWSEVIHDVVLPESTLLTGINFWTLGAPGNTHWAVYADSSGTPDCCSAPLFSGVVFATSTDIGDPGPGGDPFHNFIGINASLDAGTYWVGLGAFGSSYFVPAISPPPGYVQSVHELTTQYDYTSGGITFLQIREWAFNLEGVDPVPEPATLLLLGTGLAAAGVRRRLKKRGHR